MVPTAESWCAQPTFTTSPATMPRTSLSQRRQPPQFVGLDHGGCDATLRNLHSHCWDRVQESAQMLHCHPRRSCCNAPLHGSHVLQKLVSVQRKRNRVWLTISGGTGSIKRGGRFNSQSTAVLCLTQSPLPPQLAWQTTTLRGPPSTLLQPSSAHHRLDDDAFSV